MTNILLWLILGVLIVLAYFMFKTKDLQDPAAAKKAQRMAKAAGQGNKPRKAAPTSLQRGSSSKRSVKEEFDDPSILPIDFDSQYVDEDDIPVKGVTDRQFWTDYVNLPQQTPARRREILSVLLDYAIISREQYAAMMEGKAVPGQKDEAADWDTSEEQERQAKAASATKARPAPTPQKQPAQATETTSGDDTARREVDRRIAEQERLRSTSAGRRSATGQPTEETRTPTPSRLRPDMLHRRPEPEPSTIETYTNPVSSFPRHPVAKQPSVQQPMVLAPVTALPSDFYTDDFGEF